MTFVTVAAEGPVLTPVLDSDSNTGQIVQEITVNTVDIQQTVDSLLNESEPTSGFSPPELEPANLTQSTTVSTQEEVLTAEGPDVSMTPGLDSDSTTQQCQEIESQSEL